MAELASRTAQPLHIAGIGASAGGLEAMLPMFARLRPTGRLTYVVAQHMAKDGHDELVVRLLGRESALPMVLARPDEVLKADTVYVIPSGKDGSVQGDKLVLQEPAPHHLSTPSVNTLFSSIAKSSRGRGIGIVLSGTGSDGVSGCRALRAEGGLTIAQDPAEAKFNGMPTAAIEAKLIDKVLCVGDIGDLLAERFPGSSPGLPLPVGQGAALKGDASVSAGHLWGGLQSGDTPQRARPDGLAVSPGLSFNERAPATTLSKEQSELSQLTQLVLDATGIDFSSYKEDTLLRRLEKRVSTLGLASVSDYLAFARRQPDELNTLQHLFLVSVSSFYRDRDSFRELERALASVLPAKPAGEPVRVWVPGCASGEEPYTLAMILTELQRNSGSTHPLEIVGTDLNPEALALARAGRYRLTACKEMDESVRQRYLTTHGQHVDVNAELAKSIRFEQRDVLTGAPPALAGQIDLVSCRNLLIYMKSDLQDQLIKSFHQALRSQGLLFIGQSESLSFVGNSLFAPIDHYHRLYRRRH